MANQLELESSPYLLQHKDNPINWYSWGDEAFNKAIEENKPVFLSIGYSTCHWCHVMAKESFIDLDVAEILNKDFVAIKLDREERPDIDNIYMTVCNAMNGFGGWPLTIIMTPEKKPFFAATYLPKNTIRNRIGLIDLLKNIVDIWINQNNDILDTADSITEKLQLITSNKNSEPINSELLQKALYFYENEFDRFFGGFGSAPKFPMPHNFMFLLNYYTKYNIDIAKEMVAFTLEKMALSGINDCIGGGFHRYSTDNKWHLPHFEKMLYDQAFLIKAYSLAYKITENPLFSNTIQSIVNYVNCKLLSPDGQFFSAEDADSEGEEGKFYTFEYFELQNLLKNDFEYARDIFNILPNGNFIDEYSKTESGKNILSLINAKNFDSEKFESIRQKIYDYRQLRKAPSLDDKILTDWNAMMISALAYSGKILNKTDYLNQAISAMDILLENVFKDSKLFHRQRQGLVGINAMIDDYAYLIDALIELYQTNFNFKYLDYSIKLMDISIEKLWSDENNAFKMSENSSDLITESIEHYDGAIPSGNSIQSRNLFWLYHLTGETKYRDYLEKLISSLPSTIKTYPIGFSQVLSTKLLMESNYSEIVICTDKYDDAIPYINYLRQIINNNFLIHVKTSDNILNNHILDMLDNYPIEPEKVAIYICTNYTCEKAIYSLEELKQKIS